MIILVTKPISITPVLSLARKAIAKILPVKTITQGKSKPLVENIFLVSIIILGHEYTGSASLVVSDARRGQWEREKLLPPSPCIPSPPILPCASSLNRGGATGIDVVNSVRGHHFVLVADGRLGASGKIHGWGLPVSFRLAVCPWRALAPLFLPNYCRGSGARLQISQPSCFLFRDAWLYHGFQEMNTGKHSDAERVY